MSLVPQTKIGKIQFYTNKLPFWQTNAVAIGTTAGAVTSLEAKLDIAAEKLTAQIAAQSAAKTAVLAADEAVKALADAGADIIKAIRAKAAADGNGIYVLGDIPAPATPTPVTQLGLPNKIAVAIEGNGALNLTWKCANGPSASGTVYQVWRRTGGSGPFTYLGGRGEKKFLDETLPAGATQVTYQIQAVRSTATGPWAQFNVSFGMSSAGAMTASLEMAPKLAA
jgi:hypothetical protein